MFLIQVLVYRASLHKWCVALSMFYFICLSVAACEAEESGGGISHVGERSLPSSHVDEWSWAGWPLTAGQGLLGTGLTNGD